MTALLILTAACLLASVFVAACGLTGARNARKRGEW